VKQSRQVERPRPANQSRPLSGPTGQRRRVWPASRLAAIALAVDRRFNRAHYDAERTIEAFAARLQDAVDLDAVQADLASVVDRALEPAHLSLWTDYRR
jgi:hypothetical protein